VSEARKPEIDGPMISGPRVYGIAAHRGFADALVAGLIPRYAEPDVGLARTTLLLPSRRAVRTVTESFVRLSGGALLLPRMTVVGDLDLDEALGPLLDPLGAGEEVPPAADPTRRWLRLAALLGEALGKDAPARPVLLRRAAELARTMDRLAAEGVAPEDLLSPRVIDIVGEQAGHWREVTRTFLIVQNAWVTELEQRGEVDGPERRNLLFARTSRRWSEAPPQQPVIAAGITGASPALAKLLRTIAGLPQGAVILPDIEIGRETAVWDALGRAGVPDEPGGAPFGRDDAVTHPQYHLKLLLNRMGIARDEVRTWHRSGMGAAPPARARAIASLFLPPSHSARWVDLAAADRRLSGVRLMETAHPGEEAQAIAVLIRGALEEPEKRVALVTPDRGLARRVVSLLERWGIAADDSAGEPLSQTPTGRLFLLLAEVIAEDAAPVALLALLTHPLVRGQEGERAAWLDGARALDLALRGPRPGPGLAPLREIARERRIGRWWEEVETLLSPLFTPPFAVSGDASLADLLTGLVEVAETLCGDGMWAGADGRALSAFVEDLRCAAADAATRLDPRDLAVVLRDAMETVAVRPPWGGHPRVAIYGLLEARMSRADLVICGGLVEGVWPASPAPDALLPPAVLRALGVPGPEFRIGLSAHDLAAALGAPQVVLSWAQRDEGAPVIPSRFVLRVRAMLGDLVKDHRETEAVDLARRIDDALPATAYPRPQPMPSAGQRRVDVAVTALDRLRSDPYQFYAGSILKLRRLDPLDAEPSAAWQGTAVHAILEAWHKTGGQTGALAAIAARELDRMSSHPLMRALWRPRLMKALEWIDAEVAKFSDEGRRVIASEIKGEMHHRGIRIHGRADRIDRLSDGALAVVDYKTGQPPSNRMVEEGFALQLGLVGLIAQGAGFEGIAGTPNVFEYWSLAKDRGDDFGFRSEPILDGRKRSGIPREDFLPEARRYLDDALDRWILGNEPFTARLNPDLGGYNDFDQLMRLDEWLPQLGEAPGQQEPAR
jgi:ATP-dependent helicase/nuclease subunit B